MHCEPLDRREFERLRELARDLGRPRLKQAGRVDALLGRVQVARMGGDERLRMAVLVHQHGYRHECGSS